MNDYRAFYIDGAWVEPAHPSEMQVINPATDEAIGTISMGGQKDVDRAVAAAKSAFMSYQEFTIVDRLELLNRIIEVYQARRESLAEAISKEMGAPLSLSSSAQVPAGLAHFREIVKVLEGYAFEEIRGQTLTRREPIGVCGLITPWNWPMNQIACKVAPALAAGCTMVLKPSELAPLSARLFAEILHEAGVPAGVFNLVNGDGATVGRAIASHADVAMVSFTGSTRAGIDVAIAAAPTVKRVIQELGGKSANILLDDVDLQKVVTEGVHACFRNSGQSCNAPTRMLVQRRMVSDAISIAKKEALSVKVGDPFAEGITIGPLVSRYQFDRVQEYIRKGLEEGATLVAGGLGRPAGLAKGHFVKPTVFSDVSNQMTIARDEIFGPVLSIISYDDEKDAIRVANDTLSGLSSYVSSPNIERARCVAKGIRTGNVHINGARPDFAGAFGGFKQSGNGREWGKFGFEEFLELKTIFGFLQK
jgi:aldehyde dehydrogenase (NAD+)